MGKFKVGDKVRIREDLIVGQHYGDSRFYEGMQQYHGKMVTITTEETADRYARVEENDYHWSNEMFKPTPKNLDNLEQGDVLEHPHGNSLIVQGVIGEIVLSVRDDIKRRAGIDSITQLKDNGWTVKQDEPEEGIQEFTLQEIADKLEMDVNSLRIKE